MEALGAGEILLTSMDCDGTKAGYDLALTRAIADAVSIPVIASGGAGTLEHFYDALTEGGADAALAASLFHYKELEIMDLKKYLADNPAVFDEVELLVRNKYLNPEAEEEKEKEKTPTAKKTTKEKQESDK